MEHVYAQLCNKALPAALGGCGGGGTEQGGSIVGNVISSVVGLVMIFGFLLALAFLLTGAFQWITSGGDKTALESARNKITNAIIGLIILAATYAVFRLIGEFIGIQLPNITIPTVTGG